MVASFLTLVAVIFVGWFYLRELIHNYGRDCSVGCLCLWILSFVTLHFIRFSAIRAGAKPKDSQTRLNLEQKRRRRGLNEEESFWLARKRIGELQLLNREFKIAMKTMRHWERPPAVAAWAMFVVSFFFLRWMRCPAWKAAISGKLILAVGVTRAMDVHSLSAFDIRQFADDWIAISAGMGAA